MGNSVNSLSEESFGRRIQKRRRELGLTQRKVAAQLGIDFTYLSKLENERGETPGEDTVRRLATILKIDEEELLALAGKVSPELRTRAQQDAEFALFLRRLPSVSDSKMRELYRTIQPKPPLK